MPISNQRPVLKALASFATATMLALPATALASGSSGSSSSSGGCGLDGCGTTSTATTATNPAPVPAGVKNVTGTQQVANGNVSLVSSKVGQTGSTLRLSGTAGTAANRVVAIEDRYGSTAQWKLATLATTTSGGAFSKRWQPTLKGHLQLRAILLPAKATAVAAAASKVSSLQGTTTSSLALTIFQPAVATYETNFGDRDSCGSILSSTTIGIASPTLRCGTKVSVYYKGKEMTVPVVDHGPYGTGASYDLTYRVAKDLGLLSVGRATIGALP